MTNDMLALALEARIRIIGVTTSAPMYAKAIVEYMLGYSVSTKKTLSVEKDLNKMLRHVVVREIEEDYEDAYSALEKVDRVVILINPEEPDPMIFDAGELLPPYDMVRERLADVVEEPEDFLQILGGLSLKEIDEIIQLTSVRDGYLSLAGVMKTRRWYSSSIKGLEQVDPDMAFYLPDEHIDQWAEKNRTYLIEKDIDPRLRPRGILLHGVPGVGKTSVSKRLAQVYGLPLYRLDLSSIMSKWLGDAEQNLKRALHQIDREEPCILLVDEVEKLFPQSSGSENETTSRILGYLLWWMQEHTSRVLVVMTTNDLSRIPTELYREGRIDETRECAPLSLSMAADMAKELIKTFEVADTTAIYLRAKSKIYAQDGQTIPHAKVSKLVYESIKEAQIN